MSGPGLFLATDNWPDLVPVLQELKAHLDSNEYQRTAVLPLPGNVADLCLDPVNLARAVTGRPNLFHRSAAAPVYAAGLGVRHRRAAALHRLLFLTRPTTTRQAAAILGAHLAQTLTAADVLRVVAPGVLQSQVLAAPFGGKLYLSDPSTMQDHPEYCYLGRSTFTVPEFLRDHSLRQPGVGPSRLLDLACGAGVGAIACADGFDETIGTDIVPRCLRFARLNAVLNEAPSARFAYSDVFSHLDGTFDLIISNTPCVWSDTEPDGAPRTYANGGSEFGLQLPTRMITAALNRLRTGGTLLAVLTAPVIDRRPYVAEVFERICSAQTAQVTVYPLLEDYELRHAHHYRRYHITKMVRYLVELQSSDRFTLAYRPLDTARLRSCTARTIPARALSWSAARRPRPRQ